MNLFSAFEQTRCHGIYVEKSAKTVENIVTQKHGNVRQSQIYRDGLVGQKNKIPTDPTQLEKFALARMNRRARAYIAGGAGAEQTIRANQLALESCRIVPRMLQGKEERDLQVQLFGRTFPLPFLLAPIGVLDLAHRGADVVAARAAATEGVCFIASSQSSETLEEIAILSGDGPRWFQLYCPSNNDLMMSFVERAEQAGYEAIVVTVDTTELGWRPRDLDLGYLPFARGRGIANYVTDPVFKNIVESMPLENRTRLPPLKGLPTILELIRHWPEGWRSAVSNFGKVKSSIRCFTKIYSRPSLVWSDISFLRSKTSLPILLKGILHSSDALTALDHGVDGIIVSNHGGRQVDGAIGALEALPSIVTAVRGRVPVLFDSGIRTGSDIIKALALGAKAVLIGRPYVYALAISGEAGVRELIQNLAGDLDLNLGLSGNESIAGLSPSTLSSSISVKELK